VKKITRMPRNANDKPDNPPKINKITILHAGGTTHAAPTHHPTPRPKPKPAPGTTVKPQQ
jgi:hypothetical protein